MATTDVAKSKTRSDLVRRARMGPFSVVTALAGTVVGGAIFAGLLVGTNALLRQNDSSIEMFKAWDKAWEELGRRGVVVVGGLLVVSYLVTAFVAARMAWRRGWLHGLSAEIDLREAVDRREASNERMAPIERGDTNGHKDDGIDVDGLTKEELYEMAQEMDISGRSQMTKEELAKAVRKERRALPRR